MPIDKLLKELLSEARRQGLSEGDLARAAGLTAQGLSKAKGRGDLRLSTLLALAKPLGLDLVWRQREIDPEAIRKARAGTLFRFNIAGRR